jgi:hypothetical protein
MRKRYFDWEYVFKHICQHCDRDRLWDGDGTSVAAEFHVAEDEGHDALGELCDRGFIERLVTGTYAIVRWRERDEAGEEEQCSR